MLQLHVTPTFYYTPGKGKLCDRSLFYLIKVYFDGKNLPIDPNANANANVV